MLNINFNRIFKAKGISNPYAFLNKGGFSANFASKAKNNKVRRLDPTELEKLCVILNCTPNDLYEWIPDDNSQVDKDHELNKIKRTDKVFDITKNLQGLSMKDLEKVEAAIKDSLKEAEE